MINYGTCNITSVFKLSELPTSKYTESAFLKESRQIQKYLQITQKTRLN
jgi:hypothetical protein